jgi:endo-1,4-beta-xylanase
MGLTRREFLVGTAVAAYATPRGTLSQAFLRLSKVAGTKPLSEYGKEKGLLFGTALRYQAVKDVACANLIAGECAIGVPEGALKWNALRPTPNSHDFKEGDVYEHFLASHGMKYRGHTLLWEQALPKWFSSVVNSHNAKAMMLDHISTVVRHYAGEMHSWDVVNEAMEPDDGRPDGLKNTPWLQMIGPEYIELAFHAAHEADPQSMLVFNENWLEPEDRSTEKKRRATLSLLRGLKEKGVPVHALGIQSHLFAETPVGGPNFARFLDEIADLGVSVLITELDIRDQHLTGSVESRDQAVARKYYDYLSFMLQRKSVKAVLTWGLSSRYTWLTQHSPRPDGSPVRPLPYDSDLKPTPAWNAIASAFDQAPSR